MTAPPSELRRLSSELASAGVAGICATTLSAPLEDLERAVTSLGKWVRSKKDQPGAKVFGLHLEGPYLNPDSRGAHPLESIRPFRLVELERLWELSGRTIRILTLAPEQLNADELRKLTGFAVRNKIRLSAGHTRATEAQAERAFDAGFDGVTHLWNAMHFHHRDASVLGAALRKKHVTCELIPDGIHVSASVRRLTHILFPDRLCLVSDAAPVAGLAPGENAAFGPIRCILRDGAARVGTGSTLAGGGYLLPEMVRAWVAEEFPSIKVLARSRTAREQPPVREIKDFLEDLGRAMSTTPLRALRQSSKSSILPKLDWIFDEKGVLGFRPTVRSARR